MSLMKLKELRSYLEDVEVFSEPKIMLEQYPTTPQIAAEYLHTIEREYEAISGKRVADLGCGCGVLSIAASILGCGSCLSIDIDEDALADCKSNIENFEVNNIDMMQMDITKLDLTKNCRLKGSVDTVIMNPPFGTKKNQGIDMKFVEAGLYLASDSVYSFHKSSTRLYIQKKAMKEWGVDAEVVAQVKFNIPAMYKCHKKTSMDIEVDCIRFSHPQT